MTVEGESQRTKDDKFISNLRNDPILGVAFELTTDKIIRRRLKSFTF